MRPYNANFLRTAALVFVLMGTVDVSPSLAAVPGVSVRRLGANLDAVSDYTPNQIFVNVVKQSRGFGLVGHPWDGFVKVGADGYPLGDFGILILCDQKTIQNIGGTYKIRFTGHADVKTSAGTLKNKVFDQGKNLTTIDLDIVQGTDQVHLDFTNTGGSVKDLKVVRPGYDPVNPPLFTDAYIDHMKRLGTIRLMDFMETNGNTAKTVADLPTAANSPTPIFKQDGGLYGNPVEYAVELANIIHSDVWVNIPVQADDGYVRALAQIIKGKLDSRQKVFVEYSNELWNYPSFSQCAVNRDLAVDEVNKNARSNLAYDGDKDPYLLAMRRQARRTKEISDIFRDVFGATAKSQVRTVLAGQFVNPYSIERGVEFLKAVYPDIPLNSYLNAVSGAPYFNLGNNQKKEGLTVDQIIADLTASSKEAITPHVMERIKTIALENNLKLVAYEGGPDTFGTGSINAKAASAMDARMEGITVDFLNNWYKNGGDMFLWFNAGADNFRTQYGTWGLTTDLAITDAPKIKGLDDVIHASRPAEVSRHAIPVTFDAKETVGGDTNEYRFWSKGLLRKYMVSVPEEGDFQLSIKAGAHEPGDVMSVFVNNSLVPNASIPVITTPFDQKDFWKTTTVEHPFVSVHLKRGMNLIRLEVASDTAAFVMDRVMLK